MGEPWSQARLKGLSPACREAVLESGVEVGLFARHFPLREQAFQLEPKVGAVTQGEH